MVHENEVVMLALGIGVYFLILAYRRHLRRIPRWTMLFIAYSILLVAFVATIAEGYLWGHTLNVIEHLCYALSAVIMAVWCWHFTNVRTLGEGDARHHS